MIQKINAVIATRLEEVAGILEAQQASPYRVQAYRRAAMTVRNCDRPMDEIVREEGVEGLQHLLGIGESLSRTIHQLVTSGRLPMLERLRGESDPVEVLASVPGVGKRLAERLYTDLGIGTLEELEAAHDSRLAEIEGFGEKRIAGVRDSLAGRLGRVRKPASARAPLMTHSFNYRQVARRLGRRGKRFGSRRQNGLERNRRRRQP
jgi:DNA polymerase (family X)